jgi:transglutaminase-like putative cysteine protease
MYWRGPVLGFNDGRAWTRVTGNHAAETGFTSFGAPLRYTITLEPTNQRWLFALEMPEQAPPQGHFSHDYQLYAREPVQQRIRYALASRTDYRLDAGHPAELQRALQLPNAHARAITLGRSWQASGAEPEEIIRRALLMFNQQEFYYTLTPPLLAGDNVDEFLFETRQGFCEHYAGAFAVLMRAAGIPARIVTGYQGGEYNPIGNYLIVYQRDAHAWTEVWLPQRGWVRVDPTTAVAPERVQAGIGDALPATIRGLTRALGGEEITGNLWLGLRHTWDTVNNQWNQWVISYGPQRQMQFLNHLGMKDTDAGTLSLILAVIIVALLLALMFWLMRGHAPASDAARLVYDQFCRKLARIGMQRMPGEGPLDFARRAGKRFKSLREKIDEITRFYILARYASQGQQLAALRQCVRKFRPAK